MAEMSPIKAAEIDLDVRILEVEPIHIRIPLNRPIAIAIGEIAVRDYNLVRIHTSDGSVGCGYARGGELVHVALEKCLRPLLLNRSAAAVEALWNEMYTATMQLGRRGAVMRAISAVDIALWDIRCRRAELPLWRYLGGERRLVPCYASGGYYTDGSGLSLRQEVSLYLDRGFRAMKLKVGRLTLAEDISRVRAVREVVGDEVRLMVDANTGYEKDSITARLAAEAFADLNVVWLEEPYGPDNLEGMASLREFAALPIASGEQESTRWGFQSLVKANAIDIAQPDVTVVGGISEWLKVAALTDASGIPLAPHYFPEVHAQLAGAVATTLCVEYFLREVDIVNFDDVLSRPLTVRDGVVELDHEPGVGLDFDEARIARYRAQ